MTYQLSFKNTNPILDKAFILYPYFLKSSSSVLPSLSFHSVQPFVLPPKTNIAAELGEENDTETVNLYL